MTECAARISADGVCEYRPFDEPSVTWPSPTALAEAWVGERRADELGPVWWFLSAACAQPQRGLVDVLVALARAAQEDPDLLGAVGAGPLEDLIQHTGKDAELLTEIERAARQEPAFRAALRSVWMGSEISAAAKNRLARFGAIDITQQGTR